MAEVRTDGARDLGQELVESYLVNDRMNQVMLEHLEPRAWRAKLPGDRGRTIAAIFSHMHNVRRKWLRLSAPNLKLPAPLDRARCTQEQTRAALAESAARCSEMVRGGTAVFRRDGWAKPWPPGAAMIAYMITHDAHHRGQACMLARQLGFPLRGAGAYGIWAWERLMRTPPRTRHR
jgi:uncharacterized damage-inducible protein DinB